MTVIRLITFLVVLYLPFADHAGAEKLTHRERFAFWNKCELLDVKIKFRLSGEDKDDIGLTNKSIKKTAIDTLIQERVYGGYNMSLWVNIASIPDGFYIIVGFLKRMKDLKSGKHDTALTWMDKGTVILHQKDPNYVLYRLSQGIRHAIKKYKDVNVDSCSH